MNTIILRSASLVLAIVLVLGFFTTGRATSQLTALMPNQTVNLAFFYKPPSNSDAATVASNFSNVVLTGGDETFRGQLLAKGEFKRTKIVGSSVTFNSTGQKFTVVYKSGLLFGKMDVFGDGNPPGTIDQKSSTDQYRQKWSYGGTLTTGTHKLKLVYVGPSGARDSVDAVSIP